MISRGFIVLWIAMVVAMAGIGMVSPLLPVYVREDLGGPDIAVALSFSGIAITQFFLSPFVGRLGDRFGAKRFMVFGFAAYGTMGYGYLLADTWEQVVALRIMSGIGIAFIFPLSLAYVGRLAPAGGEGRMMGAFAVAQIVGWGIGPLAGGIVRDVFSSNVAFAAMATMLWGTGIFIMIMLPGRPRPAGAGEDYEPPEEPRLSWRELMRRKFVHAVIASGLVGSISFAASGAFLAVYVVGEEGLNTGSATFVGILLGARSLIGAVAQPTFGALADRWNRVALVAIGLGMAAVLQFLVPSVPDYRFDVTIFGATLPILPWLLALYVTLGIAESIAFPAQQAIFVTVGRTTGMGAIMGVQQMAGSIGFLGGALIGAWVVSTFGIDNVFRYAGIGTATGAIVFILLMRRAGDEVREAERLGAEAKAAAAAGG